MQQLSGADNVSLFAERRNVYNHVGTLVVYDVTTAPGGKVRFKDILRHFDERLPLHPVFRRRLVRVPFGLDRPYWVTAADLDVEYHIRHIALPRPGDWRQLMIQVARLHSRPLDRAHPLWEAYVIEGLDNIPKLPPGAFAIFLKIHHAVVDGMAAVHLLRELHTATPEADGGRRAAPTGSLDRDPSGSELLARSLSGQQPRPADSRGSRHRRHALLLPAGSSGRPSPRETWPVCARDRAASGGRAEDAVQRACLAASRDRRLRNADLADQSHTEQGPGRHSQRRIHRRRRRRRAQVPGCQERAAGGIAQRAHADFAAQRCVGRRQRGGRRAGARTFGHRRPIERLLAVHEEALASKARGEKMGLDLLKNLFDVLPPLAVSGLVERVICPAST